MYKFKTIWRKNKHTIQQLKKHSKRENKQCRQSSRNEEKYIMKEISLYVSIITMSTNWLNLPFKV